MGYLRESREAPVPAAATAEQVHPARARSDALSDAAFMAKRSADILIEDMAVRSRTLAGFSAVSGVLALLLGLAAAARIANPELLFAIAGLALLVPVAFALSQVIGGLTGVAEAAYERGFCLALAQHAKRLGDVVGVTDQRNLPLGPDAIITSQLDAVAKDLDRATQRLKAAGADAGRRSAANRLHERIVPDVTATWLTAPDGRRYPVRIIDVSQSGVALKGSMPSLGTGQRVQIGGRTAKVVRLVAGEMALHFQVPILPSEFNKRLTL